jgi:hypothetical protein
MAVQAGPFELLDDPSVGEDEPRYVNDHTFVRADDGTLHLIGHCGWGQGGLHLAPLRWDA